ncbi:ABC transporter substrate-binding protein [Caenimonas soli]|uniref:ABC transporter substrate-binding protein n=1 Tax=Caenimonas soli TaxID=2735555 RepID=UPI001552B742|nr:transporter substrate-binding domain-containing protein [Caenimonas soli]NPC58327.1 ABC transporter substrate-binding protein [Caenimonas soli]
MSRAPFRSLLVFGSILMASTLAVAQTKTVRIGWIPAVGLICPLSAVENTKSPNFKTELLSFRNSNEVLLALNTGQLDMGLLGYSVAATALTKGDVAGKFVAGATSGTTSMVVAAKTGITSWKELKGKTVGGVRGSSEYTAMENAISASGLKLGSDPKFVNFQSSTDIMVALRNGDIDAAASFEPAIAIAVAAGFVKRAPEMTRTLFSSTYSISVGWMASNDLLRTQEGQDAVVSVLKTYVSDCQRLKNNPGQAIDLYTKYQTGNREVLQDAFKSISHGLVWDIPMKEVQVIPKYVPGVEPQQVPELTKKLTALVDYGPLQKATGQSAEQLGALK